MFICNSYAKKNKKKTYDIKTEIRSLPLKKAFLMMK